MGIQKRYTIGVDCFACIVCGHIIAVQRTSLDKEMVRVLQCPHCEIKTTFRMVDISEVALDQLPKLPKLPWVKWTRGRKKKIKIALPSTLVSQDERQIQKLFDLMETILVTDYNAIKQSSMEALVQALLLLPKGRRHIMNNVL